MIKQKAVIVCDFCEKEIDNTKEHIKIEDISHEGCSRLYLENHSNKKIKNISYEYDFGESHFCNIDCFFNDIKKILCL